MRNVLSGVALLVILVAPAMAHHPFAAEYDWKKPVSITGTVTKFDWKNPHSVLEVKGKDEAGTDADWTIELGSPGQLSRFGWQAKQFKAGDRVVVDGWLAKNGTRHLSAKSVTPQGGREMAAGSSFFEERTAVPSTNRSRQVKATSGSATPAPRP